MTTTQPETVMPYAATLRRLYLTRFAFAVVWAVSLFLTSTTAGPPLTALLVVYPLVDAAAVLWQLRATDRPSGPRTAEWINVVVSVVVAAALGWAATVSIAAVLVVWGAWAVGSGVPQLVAAISRRGLGGQVPQMLSGGISVLAGASFLFQSYTGATDLGNIAGYAAVGGIFFLVSAVRLRTRA